MQGGGGYIGKGFRVHAQRSNVKAHKGGLSMESM